MKIGIKYCGGCNSRYDRTKEVSKLKKKFPQHEFTYAAEQTVCDICLLVCGCMTACAAPDDTAAKRFEQLCTPAQFAQFASALAAEPEQSLKPTICMLHIGDSASLSKTFTDTDVRAFSVLTGNYGKLYTDPAFAAQYGFGRPAVHTALVGSLLHTLIETRLPGDGAILLDQHIRFAAPAFIGDSITASAVLTNASARNSRLIVKIRGTCVNQNGLLIAEGSYYLALRTDLFAVDK